MERDILKKATAFFAKEALSRMENGELRMKDNLGSILNSQFSILNSQFSTPRQCATAPAGGLDEGDPRGRSPAGRCVSG